MKDFFPHLHEPHELGGTTLRRRVLMPATL